MERSVLRAIPTRLCYLFKILFLQPKVHFVLKTLSPLEIQPPPASLAPRNKKPNFPGPPARYAARGIIANIIAFTRRPRRVTPEAGRSPSSLPQIPQV
jgi:hypothetical protein